MIINAIAVDADPRALHTLEEFCERLEFIRLQKTFTSAVEAIKYLKTYPVDLLFADADLPAVTGIDLYKRFSDRVKVIFTSSTSHDAVEAFTLNAIDYLLKPLTFERLEQATRKAKQYFGFQGDGDDELKEYLFVRADYRFIKIMFNDIVFIEGFDDYLKIHLSDGKTVVVRLTMKSILEKLKPRNFIRVHRSYIVPLNKIESVRNRTISIDRNIIPIGATYEENFFNILKPEASVN